MNVEDWYKRAYTITQGDPLYRDYVHDVYIKVQRKKEPYNESYIYLAIYNRWLDEKRKKKEQTITQAPGYTQHAAIEYEDYDLDPFEVEVAKSLNEGYRLKEIAEICMGGEQFVYSVFRSIKKKIKQAK